MVEKIKAELVGDVVITEDSDKAREINAKSAFGKIENKKVHLALIEALYLVEKGKIEVKKKTSEQLVRKGARKQKNFMTRYYVYKDMRDRGYTVKTALKFGADFRIYDKGVKPGQDHAKWVMYPVRESEGLTWHDFSAKNRVAHSTKKRLLIGVVDDENCVTYYEIKWTRP